MEKKFNYVYLTVNLINGRGYVGSHGTDKNDSKDTYLGSGSYFLKAIKKYGKQNFIKIKIRMYDEILEARKAEEHYIQVFDTLSPKGYNVSITGGQGEWGGKLSDEYKQKISIGMQGKNAGNIPWNKGMKMDEDFCQKTLKGINEKRTPNVIGKNHKPHKAHKRRPLSEEHKQAIREKLQKYKKTDLHKQHLSESMIAKQTKFL